jgi:tetratricopeptide (TPR) repeat protein
VRIAWCMTIVLLAGLYAGPAAAQRSDDQAAAEQLFVQGRALMEQGKLDEACRALEASHKLDPAPGTLLNLALCNEKQGKVATAWALYREVENLARREGQAKREATARERARALQAELPRLLIEVAAQGRIPGLSIEREGSAVDPALWGQAVYVDPGAHRIVARAPGYKDWVAEIMVEKGKQASVEIPALQRDDTEASGRDAVGGQDPGSDAKGAAGPGQDGGASGKSGRTRRIVGLGAGGAGVAALAAGLGFGWSARSTWNDAFTGGLCDADALTCSPAGQVQTDRARSRALVSNILVAAGVALAATGGALYVTAPGPAEKAGIAVVPVAAPSELGVAVQGGF